MYFLDNWYKFLFVFVLVVGYNIGYSFYTQSTLEERTQQDVQQFKGKPVSRDVLTDNMYPMGFGLVCLIGFFVFVGDLRKMLRKSVGVGLMLLMCTTSVACYRPFEPIKLEVVGSNEEAFLLPYVGDSKEQSSSDNEEYLRENLVFGRQIKIPQQWVSKGFERFGANGAWQDAAVLIKVDKSPVTREWTADSTSGTSNKNEAIWVMTSDQVEFSTGWTITARISSRDDAVKFLHNYPNGSLEKVLDTEVRSKLQSTFGLEVTDLPMDKLRSNATPHIQSTSKTVEAFFKERGITITNLGISGGFVYKDPSILATMVKVFNAEQEKAVSAAMNAAQVELNLKDLSIKKTEADGLLEIARGNAKKIEIDAQAKLVAAESEAKAKLLAAESEAKSNELVSKSITPDLIKLRAAERWDGALPKFSGVVTPFIDVNSVTK